MVGLPVAISGRAFPIPQPKAICKGLVQVRRCESSSHVEQSFQSRVAGFGRLASCVRQRPQPDIGLPQQQKSKRLAGVVRVGHRRTGTEISQVCRTAQTDEGRGRPWQAGDFVVQQDGSADRGLSGNRGFALAREEMESFAKRTRIFAQSGEPPPLRHPCGTDFPVALCGNGCGSVAGLFAPPSSRMQGPDW